MELLEHVPDPASTVRRLRRAERGRARTVFFFGDQPQPKSYLFAVIGAEYLSSSCPRAPRLHEVIRPSELARPLPGRRLEVRGGHRMTYNPFHADVLAGRDTDVNLSRRLRAQGERKLDGVAWVLFDLDGTFADTAPD